MDEAHRCQEGKIRAFTPTLCKVELFPASDFHPELKQLVAERWREGWCASVVGVGALILAFGLRYARDRSIQVEMSRRCLGQPTKRRPP